MAISLPMLSSRPTPAAQSHSNDEIGDANFFGVIVQRLEDSTHDPNNKVALQNRKLIYYAATPPNQRLDNITYKNTSTVPIAVGVTAGFGQTDTRCTLKVLIDEEVASIVSRVRGVVQGGCETFFFVPPGSSYKVLIPDGHLMGWYEIG